ncbi:MAG: nucleotidyltransferase family protein [Gemmatimonadetes bacterium]|nr:nucleotidyltransferase family protein [Gemmatimonadota bacterium]
MAQGAPSVSGVVLAAGASTRMGRPKQLLSFHGKPLLQHVLDTAEEAGLDEIILVLGHAADEIRDALAPSTKVHVVRNADHASGHASSLRAGLLAASPRSAAAVILLGDQPTMTVDRIQAVIREYGRSGTPVARADYDGTPGHPVVLARTIWDEVSAGEGDEGAKPVLARHPEWVTRVSLQGSPPLEVDTPDDYRRLVAEA